MDAEDCQVMNSKPSDPRQRRPDGRMYFVKNEEQSGSDDWQIANVVDWRRQRLECSSRPGTSVPDFEDTGELSLPACILHSFRNTKPVQFIMQKTRWALIELASARDETGCSVQHTLPQSRIFLPKIWGAASELRGLSTLGLAEQNYSD